MSAYFELVLDTTGPVIEVYAPSYATGTDDIEITIQANERLGQYQEFYLIDANGTRHDYIFDYYGDHYYGIVDTSNLPVGMAIFYARAKDEVFNFSNEAQKAIEIKQTVSMTIEASDEARILNAESYERAITLLSRERPLDAFESAREIQAAEDTRLIADNTERIGGA